MSTGDKAPASALSRFKRSVSRIASKRKDAKRQQPDTSESSLEGFAIREEAQVVREQEQLPANDSWKVDPLLESFSESLHDVLDIHTVVSKAQKSLKGAERVTAALKEQSAAALEIAKQDFCFATKKESDYSGAAGPIRNKFREIERNLDALEWEIESGTLESMRATIIALERMRSDISLGMVPAAAGAAPVSADGQVNSNIHILKKVDELKRLLIDRLLAKRERAVQDTDVFKISSLLGQLTSPRVELQSLLEHYSTIMSQKVSSDIVSLSVSNTVQFVREDGNLSTPSRLSSDLGFTMMSMLLDAHERSQDLVERHSLKQLSNVFDTWAQQQVRETCEVLLRLVILPMAVPKGFHVVSECISLFQNYCRAIESVTEIHLQSVVMSVLNSPFMDMYMKKVEQHIARVCDIAAASGQNEIVVAEGVEILALLKPHEYILGHQRLTTARKMAEQYVCSYINALPAALQTQTLSRDDLKKSLLCAILDG